MRSASPEAGPSKAPAKSKAKAAVAPSRKPTLFDDLDAGIGKKRTAEDRKALNEKLLAASTDDESSLSSLSEDEFEDVPPKKNQKANDQSEDEDEDIQFEDVPTYTPPPTTSAPMPSGDLELTLTKDTRVSITNPFGTKKGPSKIERQIRIATHRAHVQMLMWHNAIRNAWCCDKELQVILVKGLPQKLLAEVEKWRQKSGLVPKKDETLKGKGKGKGKALEKGNKPDTQRRRDFEQGGAIVPDGKDPLMKLLRVLVEYWKVRFRITAPGIRKIGYMSLQRLDEESKSFKEDKHDPERHGERIKDIADFRERAKVLEGSRDVGAQLFTALLRGIGVECRLVASLQPVGFGWSQIEEASEKNPRVLKQAAAKKVDDSESEETSASEEDAPVSKTKKKQITKSLPANGKRVSKTATNSKTAGGKGDSVELSDTERSEAASDDESVVDVTPSTRRLPSLPYDKDLLFPHYWTELLSPVTNTYTPVDAIVLRTVATSQLAIEKFEPRGAKSEKAKQVTAYIIGHSSDGTAKDVTTRYLKHHTWPGRTKGSRYPIEKIPIYDKHGKIKRYEQEDWFKKVMSGYVRGSKKCPRTEIDDHEEATDLKPVQPQKKEVEEGKETLQYYKSSPEFVLERFFKREEALVPGAKHVKMFTVKGKGDSSTEDKVFLRKDIVNCKSTETWHKEGRAPKPGEEPLKRVPYRAATTNRRRELAEAENASGEKVLQGLFSRAQTDWIIPPPIENGIIPKNTFGNIDLYVDSMLPEGAVHIPYRGTVKICKRLEIDYAEAVTGFEFGHRMAVPVVTGVVVAEEHYDAVLDEWQKDEAERVRKEDEKRKKAAIDMWRKMLMGLRIVVRIREEYGEHADENPDVLNPWSNQKAKDDDAKVEAQKRIMDERDEEMAGGFLPEGFDAEAPDDHRRDPFFPVAIEDGDGEDSSGFVVDHGDGLEVDKHEKHMKFLYPTTQSLESASKPAVNGQQKDVDMEDRESTSDVPMPKKRGRPAAPKKTSEPKAAPPKPKKPANKPTQKRAPVAKGGRKNKTTIPTSSEEDNGGGDDDDDELSSLSEPESGPEEEEEKPVKKALAKKAAPKKTPTRKATLPTKKVESTRKTPRRQATKKCEAGLKSHYFEHSGDEDEDDG